MASGSAAPTTLPLNRGTGPALALREVTAEDEPFLFRVYAESRAEELAQVQWTEEQRHAFLLQQFTAQLKHYREHYDAATYQVVLADGEPVGRLFVARWREEIRVMDVALLTGSRRAGIGTRLLAALCDEADDQGKSVGIHVEKLNPALRLYQRLGFVEREDRGVYLYLVRPPTTVR
jgi:GNAT superfamily N-acetyltransferase